MLDESVSPETQALAWPSPPLAHAACGTSNRLLDMTGHDIYHRADTDAEDIRTGFVAHLARGPEVIWAHVRHGNCPVCVAEWKTQRGLAAS